MAANDFRVHREPSAVGFPQAASAAFREGEPVVVSSGGVTEAADDPAFVTGIAATRAVDVDGVSLATGAKSTIYMLDASTYFQTVNFATDGAGTSATPTQANAVGQVAGFSLTGGTWYVDTGAANPIVRIEAVLDARGQALGDDRVLPGTGKIVVFRGV